MPATPVARRSSVPHVRREQRAAGRRRDRTLRRALAVLVVLGACGTGRPADAAEPFAGLKAPPGFEVTLYADDDLAHDIHALAIDSLGRVVVSGPGFVRILVDADGDGQAEAVKVFAEAPKSGAQGLFFLGRDLLCTGDEGLLRFADRDGDDRADGPPDTFLQMRTGAEHHTHSVQRGPDGWWYVIAGNNAGITAAYATRSTSPVKRPQAGVLMRFDPALAGGEVLCDGYRNAYDFAFDAWGDLFVYDSDGEREVSLPWYRPIRLFQAQVGSHAGWVTESWKRPDHFADMPPVVASFGRGSPTGVVCYRHRQFPAKYRGALFVLDWTYGRVHAVSLVRDGARRIGEASLFLSAVGQHGFAPTDAAVGPDGSLFVSVGGRGTRGSVYRVRWVGEGETVRPAGTVAPPSNAAPAPHSKDARFPERPASDSVADRLEFVLAAPQPLDAWSRARWEPVAESLGRDPFVAAAGQKDRSAEHRVRAIEILVERFAGLPRDTAVALARDADPLVRARAAWALGRRLDDGLDLASLAPFVDDSDPHVRRTALDALAGRTATLAKADESWTNRLVAALGSPDRFVRLAAIQLVAALDSPRADAVFEAARRAGPQAEIAACLARVLHPRRFDPVVLEACLKHLETDKSSTLRLQAVRAMQLALGDVGPRDKRPAAYDGYAPRADLAAHERTLDPVRTRVAALYPTGQNDLDAELARLLALLGPLNPDLLDRVLARVAPESSVVDDLHHLLVASRIAIERHSRQTEATARALVDLDTKLRAEKRVQDTAWNPRTGELYKALVRFDPALPATIVRDAGFGRSGHVLFLSEASAEDLPLAVAAFVRRSAADPDFAWTNDVVFVLGESTDPAHRALVRSKYDDFAVRGAVLVVLSEKPAAEDRAKFVAGLEASQPEVLSACIAALEKLPASQAGAEQFALLAAARRLGADKSEVPLRDRLVKLLERNTGFVSGYRFESPDAGPQAVVFARWSERLEQSYPDAAAARSGPGATDPAALRALLAGIDWSQGDASRGRALFAKRSCLQCHGSGQALGPDLAGATKRFSREDLFTAIALPSRDVSPRYQTTLIQTVAGKTFSGLVIYQSVDGLLLRNASNQTFRLETADIELRRTLPTSIMPEGLLKDLAPQDLADLYAFLETLGK